MEEKTKKTVKKATTTKKVQPSKDNVKSKVTNQKTKAKTEAKNTVKNVDVEKKTVAKKAAEKKVKTSSTKKVSETKAEKKQVKKTAIKKTTTKEVTKAETSKSKKEDNKTNYPLNVKIWGYNQLVLNTNLYEEVDNAKAVVIIAHGMMEHSGRYDQFAKFLNKNSYIAITTDLRGHGQTALSKEKLGFGEKDIFKETLIDLQGIVHFAKERFNLPIYLFGHSYGSLLSQRLIQICPDIEKCVLCGTTNGSATIMKLGGMVCSLLSPFKGKTSTGGMIEKMCIKSYGKKFKNGNWLTRDEKIFEEYQKDPYCGGTFPFSFYKSMIKNCNKNNDEIYKIGRKKIFLIVGSADPLSSGGKQVEKLHRIYLKRNIDSKLKIYKDARHELLNEINKVEVWQDVIKFYNS